MTKPTSKPPAAKKTAAKKTTPRKAAPRKPAAAKRAPARPAKKAAAEPAIQAVPDGSVGCARCGKPFKPRQRNQRFCSEECRKAAGKARQSGKAEQAAGIVIEMPDRPDPDGSDGSYLPGLSADRPVYKATLEQLQAASREDTFAGRLALDFALRIDNSVGVTGMPQMSKELRDLVAEAVKDAEQSDDTADQLRAAALRLLNGA